MPIFEYQCSQGHKSARLRKFSQRNKPVVCDCGRKMKRVFSVPHCVPDGMYSYAPNLGDPNRFERQQEAIKARQEGKSGLLERE